MTGPLDRCEVIYTGPCRHLGSTDLAPDEYASCTQEPQAIGGTTGPPSICALTQFAGDHDGFEPLLILVILVWTLDKVSGASTPYSCVNKSAKPVEERSAGAAKASTKRLLPGTMLRCKFKEACRMLHPGLRAAITLLSMVALQPYPVMPPDVRNNWQASRM